MLLSNHKVFMATQAVDMRKSIDSLSVLVSVELEKSPMDGCLYLFFNKLKDKVKILYWDRNGFVLYYKRLEKSRFKIPAFEGETYQLDECKLQWLLSGLDISKARGHTNLSCPLGKPV